MRRAGSAGPASEYAPLKQLPPPVPRRRPGPSRGTVMANAARRQAVFEPASGARR